MELKSYFAQDTQGNALPGAFCYVYDRGTTAPATGVVDKNGSPLVIPFVSDSDGLITFSAPDGLYDLRVVSGDRDYTLGIQCLDVSAMLADARAEADRAATEADAAAASAAEANTNGATAGTAAAQAVTARFLPASATDPTTRADGSALQLGDRYLNTGGPVQEERIYKNTGWVANEFDPTVYSASTGATQVGAVTPTGTGNVQTAMQAWADKARTDVQNKLAGLDITAGEGAQGVGRAARQIFSLAELQVTPGRYNYDTAELVQIAAANPAAGESRWYWGAALTTTADNVNVIQVVGVTTGRWMRYKKEKLYLETFGGNCVAGFDNSQAMKAAHDFIAAAPFPKPALCINGICEWTNAVIGDLVWDIDDFELMSDSTAYLRYKGTGIAFDFDGGAALHDRVVNVTFGHRGNLVFQGVAGMGNTVRARTIIQGNIRFRVHGGSTTAAALLVQNSVCVKWDYACFPGEANGTAWYGGAIPAVGITCGDKGIADTQTSFCDFRLNIAGVPIAGYFDATLGNNIDCGDAEYCTDTGFIFTANAIGNKVRGTNFEVNTNYDVVDNGVVTEHIATASQKVLISATSKSVRMEGGMHDNINIGATAFAPLLSGVAFNRGLGTGAISDGAAKTRHSNNVNMQTGLWQNAPLSRSTPAPVPAPGGVWTYTNDSGHAVRFHVAQGATISNITWYAAGGAHLIPYNTTAGVGAGMTPFLVGPGEQVQVSYTGTAPTVSIIKGGI